MIDAPLGPLNGIENQTPCWFLVLQQNANYECVL